MFCDFNRSLFTVVDEFSTLLFDDLGCNRFFDVVDEDDEDCNKALFVVAVVFVADFEARADALVMTLRFRMTFVVVVVASVLALPITKVRSRESANRSNDVNFDGFCNQRAMY